MPNWYDLTNFVNWWLKYPRHPALDLADNLSDYPLPLEDYLINHTNVYSFIKLFRFTLYTIQIDHITALLFLDKIPNIIIPNNIVNAYSITPAWLFYDLNKLQADSYSSLINIPPFDIFIISGHYKY